MDHQRENDIIKWWEGPPKLSLSEEELSLFADGLEEIIPEKLTELMARQDRLTEEYYARQIMLVQQEPRLDEVSLHFWLFVFELDYLEFDVIQKWIRYWLRLAEKTTLDKSWITVDEHGVSENEIENAREFPVEEIFEDDLKQAGTRLVGTCPFHEEKTASFTIFTNENNFYCFGCHKYGDGIELYMKLHACDFPTAVRALQ